MRFYHEGKPIAKARHRMVNKFAYDPQEKEKNQMKWQFTAQLASQCGLKALEGAIAAQVDISYQIPKSWAKNKRITANYKTSRGDLDNIIKFYFDVLNGIAYKDDSQIVSLFAQKKYSDKQGVEITLFPLEDKLMINEHAITYKDKLSAEDLDYLAKKANRLGLANRQILRAFQEEDNDGTHVYFSVEGMKEKDNG